MVSSGALPKSEASLAERPLQVGLVYQAARGTPLVNSKLSLPTKASM
jgi:hypothetical protein